MDTIKKKNINYIVGLICFSLCFSFQHLYATESGPDNCGNLIKLTGNTNHSGNPQGYRVANATDNNMYKQEIYGSDFTAHINNLAAGKYTLKIFMAESYHNTASKRSFTVYVENRIIARELDIFAKVGKDTEYLLSQSFRPCF